MRKPSYVIVLAEDSPQQSFVRRYLQCVGLTSVRYVSLPAGGRCGEQYVRQNYAGQLRACRARQAKAETALIVVIDADTSSVEDRAKQLAESLRAEGISGRGPDERVAHLIPKRNIETWILCLTGRQVDEDQDYSHRRNIQNRVKPAACAFFELSRDNASVPDLTVPSLRAAIPEVRRIE